MDVMETAALIKSGRERRGWSAAELARRVIDLAHHQGEDYSLTQQAVSHFESGKSKSIPRWVRWANIVLLSETRDDLFKQLLSPRHIDLLDMLHGASEEQIDSAFDILRDQQPTPSAQYATVQVRLPDPRALERMFLGILKASEGLSQEALARELAQMLPKGLGLLRGPLVFEGWDDDDASSADPEDGHDDRPAQQRA